MKTFSCNLYLVLFSVFLESGVILMDIRWGEDEVFITFSFLLLEGLLMLLDKDITPRIFFSFSMNLCILSLHLHLMEHLE